MRKVPDPCLYGKVNIGDSFNGPNQRLASPACISRESAQPHTSRATAATKRCRKLACICHLPTPRRQLPCVRLSRGRICRSTPSLMLHAPHESSSGLRSSTPFPAENEGKALKMMILCSKVCSSRCFASSYRAADSARNSTLRTRRWPSSSGASSKIGIIPAFQHRPLE